MTRPLCLLVSFGIVSISQAPAATAESENSDLAAALHGLEVAQDTDFVASILEAAEDNGLVRADFDGDGTKDVAVLAVDRARKTFRFLLLVNRGHRLTAVARRDFPALADAKDGFVYSTLMLKPKGALGQSRSKHSPLGASQFKAFRAGRAVEVWVGQARNAKTAPAKFDL